MRERCVTCVGIFVVVHVSAGLWRGETLVWCGLKRILLLVPLPQLLPLPRVERENLRLEIPLLWPSVSRPAAAARRPSCPLHSFSSTNCVPDSEKPVLQKSFKWLDIKKFAPTRQTRMLQFHFRIQVDRRLLTFKSLLFVEIIIPYVHLHLMYIGCNNQDHNALLILLSKFLANK